MSAQPLLQEIAAIADYLDAARAIVKDGHIPDISALEKRIADVCLDIQAAEPEVQSQCLPKLAALLRHLGECEQDMRQWHKTQTSAGGS